MIWTLRNIVLKLCVNDGICVDDGQMLMLFINSDFNLMLGLLIGKLNPGKRYYLMPKYIEVKVGWNWYYLIGSS